jgi:phosphatidylserine decarboxylase
MFFNYISHIFGAIINLPLPKPLARLSIAVFTWIFKIDASEATKEIVEYKSIGEFFVRDLKPALRPIADGIVSPVDGTLRDIGRIDSGLIPEVKGRSYSVSDLLDNAVYAGQFANGAYINLYLAPRDCHHVFMPCDGVVEEITRIPGALWPVNNWSVNNIPRLFVKNERAVIKVRTDLGLCAIVMVGALNVGKIVVYPELEKLSKKGAKIGTFYMGSTVVLLFEKIPGENNPRQSFPCKVQYGEKLTI